MANDNVPFLDLVAAHEDIEEELVAAVRTALRAGRFAGGPMVEGFESDFATFCDVPHCIGVSSGTDALRFALMASGIRKDDTVITVPNTFVATTEAITQAGAVPEFVDVDADGVNLDPEKLREFLEAQKHGEGDNLISRRTGRPITGVIPVHLYGRMANMGPILALAEKYNLIVVEDACQAHGADYFSESQGRWLRAGSIGRAAAFSFYPGKNLGACGEAGAVTTGSDEIAERVRVLRDHGQRRKYYHDIEGYNGRLDSIQAGMLRIKLKHLPDWTEARRELAAKYGELLGSIPGLTAPSDPIWSRSVHHLYVIRVRDRDALQERLTKAGIGTGLHYPLPLHLQAAYSNLGYSAGDLPVAEKAASELLSLPMYPQLTFDQLERVVEAVKEHFQGSDAHPLLESKSG